MPASPKPTKKEVVTAFRTREILAAARRVMEQRGLEAMTMEEIALAAGVAKGTIYLYFQGKEDLIQALMSQAGEKLNQDLEGLVNTSDAPEKKLHRAVTLLLNLLERERLLFPMYARVMVQGEHAARRDSWRQIRELEEKSVALLTHLFAEGIETGQFIRANPRLLTFLLRGLVRAVGYYQMAEGKKDAVKEALPVLLQLFSGLSLQARGPGKVTPT
jgi:AcrR family transcriptional regulator